jgi:hypothetical protein
MPAALDSLFLSPETVNHAVQVICHSLGTFLAFAGLKKLLTRWTEAETTYRSNGFSTAEYRNTAILEIIGSAALFFPRTRFAGVAVLILMIAFIEIRSKRTAPRPPLYFEIPARITQVLLVGLAWVLRPRFGEVSTGLGI